MTLGDLQIIKQHKNACSAAVIFLHGSCSTGQDILDLIKSLIGDISLPHIKFYFPTSPLIPYTLLEGKLSNVWFDRYKLLPDVPEHVETLNSVSIELNELIDQICKENNLAPCRIIIGGFSMGGALALHAGYRNYPGLAGVFALSSFLNYDSVLLKEPNFFDAPLYMCHGESDTYVPFAWGKQTFEDLKKLGINGEFHPIQNASHELKKHEILDLLEWIKKIVPDTKTGFK